METRLIKILATLMEAHTLMRTGSEHLAETCPEGLQGRMSQSDQALMETHHDLEQMMKSGDLAVLLAALRGEDTTPKNELRFAQAAGGSRIYITQGHVTLEMDLLSAGSNELSELLDGSRMLAQLASSRLIYMFNAMMAKQKEGS